MVSPAILAKQDPSYPDYYVIKIFYINGRMEEFKVAQHRVDENYQQLEFWTYDENGVDGDIHNWVPLSSVSRIQFDKNFSKMYAMECEKRAKEAQNGVRD